MTEVYLKSKCSEIILGIDPGTIITGYGLIKVNNNGYEVLDYGCIKPPYNLKLSDRYLIIFEGILSLIEKFLPHGMVVETQYVHRNVQTAIKLGMARGVAIIAAKQRGVSVFEYAPSRAKLAVVGSGKASKEQVQSMVAALLNLKSLPTPLDASDALALAICHAQTKMDRLEI